MHHARILPSNWIVRHDPPADGATNMARDLALLEAVAEGVATWRWYAWDHPTVSFGRNERTAGWYTADSVAAAGLAVVRRPTGGRALLHARELTYSVTCPLPVDTGWRAAYDAINAVLLATLQAAGVPATLSTGTSVAPEGLLCFDLPASGEIAVHGRKLVGSAVWRHGRGYLQHGSLLIDDDQARLLDARVDVRESERPTRALPPAAATLSSLFPSLDARTIVARIVDMLPSTLQSLQVAGAIHRLPDPNGAPDQRNLDAVTRHREAMTDPAWIWRR